MGDPCKGGLKREARVEMREEVVTGACSKL